MSVGAANVTKHPQNVSTLQAASIASVGVALLQPWTADQSET